MVLSKLQWWRQDEEIQNFGDALSPFLETELAAEPISGSKIVRLIGSVIANSIVRSDIGADLDDPSVTVTYWGCGKRDDAPIKRRLRNHLQCHAVRGPLTRDALALPLSVPIGDPALLLPILYRVTTAGHRKRTLCVPHFNEQMSDADLLQSIGVDDILRPNIAGDKQSLLHAIDTIASAEFVVAGALHAAIVAAAYQVPFAYLDTGHVNVPFKWLDFSASVDMPTVFIRSLAEGKRAWSELLGRCIRLPPMTPLLAAFPSQVRPAVMQRSAAYDEQQRSAAHSPHVALA